MFKFPFRRKQDSEKQPMLKIDPTLDLSGPFSIPSAIRGLSLVEAANLQVEVESAVEAAKEIKPTKTRNGKVPAMDKTDLVNGILNETQELYQRSVSEYREQCSKGEFSKAAETISYGRGLLKAISVLQFHHMASLYKDAKDAQALGQP